MSDHVLMQLFALAFSATLLWLFITVRDRNDWRDSYKALSAEVLRDGQAQTRRIVRELDAVHQTSLLTWDEIIDAQG